MGTLVCVLVLCLCIVLFYVLKGLFFAFPLCCWCLFVGVKVGLLFYPKYEDCMSFYTVRNTT